MAILLLQISTLFRQIVVGQFWSSLFVASMMGFTGVFFYYLANRPLITADKFPEDFEDLDGVMLNKWWDSYTHPLIARGGEGLMKNTADQSFSQALSQGKTSKGQHVGNTQQQLKDSQANHPVLPGDEGLADLSHDVMMGSYVGAKPKSLKERQNQNYKILTERLDSSSNL